MDLNLLQALYGNTSDENSYLAQDPFYGAARSVAGWQLQPRNDSEALWMPMLQGALMGALGGYGKSSARQAQYDDFRSFVNSPLLAQALAEDPSLADAFASETRPDGFSPKAAKNQLLMAALTQQKIDDQEEYKQRLKDQLDNQIKLQTDPAIIDAEINKATRLADVQARLQQRAAGGLPGIPKGLQDDAQKEIVTKASEKDDEKFVDDLFDEAKKTSRMFGAIGIPFTGIQSATADKLEGIQGALQAKAQKRLGSEPSDKFRSLLAAAMPSWADSDANIDAKRDSYKTLLKGMRNPTPILDSLKPLADPRTSGPDLSGYTQAQIDFMKKKGML